MYPNLVQDYEVIELVAVLFDLALRETARDLNKPL